MTDAAKYKYSLQDCERTGGHYVGMRQSGPPVQGGAICERCGVETSGNHVRLLPEQPIPDPLGRFGGRVA
jgi:hypothetical protein